MGKIQDAHHAENQREPAGQHKQQHSENQAVQNGKNNIFYHVQLPWGKG